MAQRIIGVGSLVAAVLFFYQKVSPAFYKKHTHKWIEGLSRKKKSGSKDSPLPPWRLTC
jgi:hypothetical protein